MTQEDKELLLKDLSARLPYGVIVKHFDTKVGSEGNLVNICILDDITTTIINEEGYEDIAFLIEAKPYLRPMSSMTEEEKKRYDDILTKMYYHEKSTLGDISDYLNSIHVDYRGLIEKGLAIKITEENNPYNK